MNFYFGPIARSLLLRKIFFLNNKPKFERGRERAVREREGGGGSFKKERERERITQGKTSEQESHQTNQQRLSWPNVERKGKGRKKSSPLPSLPLSWKERRKKKTRIPGNDHLPNPNKIFFLHDSRGRVLLCMRTPHKQDFF